ncbi:MAG: hypothetical protein GY937_04360 [bacterium]|nr:hypothetical protein [bacterium]
MADPHGMIPVSPGQVLSEIAAAVPADCREHLIVIGSLAVGYHYFADETEMVVRTKDADCVVSPRGAAVDVGIEITNKLISNGWTPRQDAHWSTPGTASTPDDELPAVRLQPPGGSGWFIELLTVPGSPADAGRQWLRIQTDGGDFGLCSFRFLSLSNLQPIETPLGVAIARPEMMALANLLEHPEIGPELMTAGFAGRSGIKRSNKDLGRVIAISTLALAKDEDALLPWSELWRDALIDRFPTSWRELAERTGAGLKAILASDVDLEQAQHTCVNGLLTSRPPTLDQFRANGQRLLAEAANPLVELVRTRE